MSCASETAPIISVRRDAASSITLPISRNGDSRREPTFAASHLGSRIVARSHYEVRGKTVLVTGAARGIGAETARRMHARGANVVLCGLEPEELERRAGELGDRAAWFEVDVTDLEDRKSTRLNSSHANISYAVFCLKKKNIYINSIVRY